MRVAMYWTYLSLVFAASLASAQTGEVRTGAAALDSWKADASGVRRHIKPSDLPAPAATDPETSKGVNVKVVERPEGALPNVPDGFAVQVFAGGFKQPRTLRVAPNGDIFLSESGAGRVLVFRAGAGGPAAKPEVFAENLDRPYGIVFLPPADPRYVYVAAANQVVRYPYRSGAVKAAGPAEVVVSGIPTKRHWTRDLAVSRDGKKVFVSVGSASNLGVGGMPEMTPDNIRQHETIHGRGAAWGEEKNRAVVRVFDPDGKNLRNYATGLRNCSGLAVQPGTDHLWCVVNERDHLGPELVPDYMARMQDGGFYGWPWYYIGDHEDPASRSQGSRDGARGAVPGALLCPERRVLRSRRLSGRVPGRRLRRAARLPHPPRKDRLQSGPRAHEGRQTDRRVRRLPDRLHGGQRHCLGPAGGSGGHAGWRAAGER
jgi:glucose/arabinose dehydrogenase